MSLHGSVYPEVLDVTFNAIGSEVATASADGTSRIYDAKTGRLKSKCEGHEGEISKVAYNYQGTRVLTAGIDKTARLWDPTNGECMQILRGHTEECIQCIFNFTPFCTK